MRQFWGWSPFDKDKIQRRKPKLWKARAAVAALNNPPPEAPEPEFELVRRKEVMRWRKEKRSARKPL